MKKAHDLAQTRAWMATMEETFRKAHTEEGARTGGAQPPSPPPSSSLNPNGSFQGSTEVRINTNPLLDQDEENYTEVNKEPAAQDFPMFANLEESCGS